MRVGIIGIGAIGGSMALKLSGSGVDVLVDDVDHSLVLSLQGKSKVKRFDPEHTPVDVLVLATPMRVEERLLQVFAFPPDVTIMDVASVKTPFVKLAESRNLRFVGGHPMAGSTHRKAAGWNPDVFSRRPFFLCRTIHSKDEDVERAEMLVHLLGADPVWVRPEEHDKIVSKVSHITYFLSLIARKLGEEFERFAGPGFHSTTRLSHQNPEMVMDMVRYNAEHILGDLKAAHHLLGETIKAVESGDISTLLELEGENGCEESGTGA